MSKVITSWVCTECGANSAKWMGQCSHCKAWNTLKEFKESSGPVKYADSFKSAIVTELSQVEIETTQRLEAGLPGLDRLLGGGIVPGSLTLLGGEPGIGKSTLLTQLSAEFARKGRKVLYICGEESTSQVSLRAERLGVSKTPIFLLSETRFEEIEAAIEEHQPELVIVDSIQVMYTPSVPSAPGALAQVRELAGRFMHLAKRKNIAHVLVGHVTKSGEIAGPKVLEHTVDTVVYFEADLKNTYRLLRVVKNRFGPCDEIAVFQMKQKGLEYIESPSKFFMQERRGEVAGSAVVPAMEGTRPFLVEVQALVTKTVFPTPSRRASGFDPARLALLIAVMEKRAGFALYQSDIFLSIAGGLKLQETAADLGVVFAIASSFLDKEVPSDLIILGEVGLGGEVRAVSHIEQRLKEAAHLGFKRALVPQRQKANAESVTDLKVFGCADVSEAIRLFF